MNRLLDPMRNVIIERTLRYPQDKVIREFCPYYLSQIMVLEFPFEENTAKVRIMELDDELWNNSILDR